MEMCLFLVKILLQVSKRFFESLTLSLRRCVYNFSRHKIAEPKTAYFYIGDYRLKQTDKDRGFAYNTISVNLPNSESKTLRYLNPVSDRLFIKNLVKVRDGNGRSRTDKVLVLK